LCFLAEIERETTRCGGPSARQLVAAKANFAREVKDTVRPKPTEPAGLEEPNE